MSLREWLIAIGTLVILGIVIDGVRRMRRARKESMAISSGMGADRLDESPLDEDYNPELPNGGARTISREVLEQRGYVRPERPTARGGTPKPTRPVTEARASAQAPDHADEAPAEDGFSSREPGDDLLADAGWGARDDDEALADGVIGQARVVRPEPEASGLEEPDELPEPEPVPPTVTTEVEEDTARRPVATERRPNQPLAGANRPEAREVIVINVLARKGEQFQGAALKKLFEACGLEHGDMDIYHRHEEPDTTSPVQFSVANAVEPGTFRPEDMPALSTPGISFFMSLPGPSNAMQAFDFMLETAQCVVRNLGGELKDERRSVMTPQTVEHCRQRIREFERKQRSQRV
ncbi:cell division protein ZipA [uncultured Marinobacter sp.]|uniref:cell division protein ZipA n=1 Tax=uncultured Marinobacter sp. TaxID=187379 RepID=UPI000C636835|nr:cell division protein ZipA [Oceanospirillales bacterium]|tara:strand:+ start:5415 stop:6467 length:1053 start_codon:yes stop_codon:yes gene_type:complete